MVRPIVLVPGPINNLNLTNTSHEYLIFYVPSIYTKNNSINNYNINKLRFWFPKKLVGLSISITISFFKI
jgi:hypothetical protein